MKIKVLRDVFTEKSTTGHLHIDGAWQCYTLEDRVRADGSKLYGETAIPAGTYKITLRKEGTMYADLCKRFAKTDIRQERGTLWIRDIPGFEYVLIHPGNYPSDTLGCLLVGLDRGADCLTSGTSTGAYLKIYPQIADVLEKGGEVTIEYINDGKVLA